METLDVRSRITLIVDPAVSVVCISSQVLVHDDSPFFARFIPSPPLGHISMDEEVDSYFNARYSSLYVGILKAILKVSKYKENLSMDEVPFTASTTKPRKTKPRKSKLICDEYFSYSSMIKK